jgi:hypothetical protein
MSTSAWGPGPILELVADKLVLDRRARQAIGNSFVGEQPRCEP